MHATPETRRRNERGVVIIWTALFLLLMLGFVAIGIDVAKVMATQSELQNAADAAALAGASAINLQTGQLRPDSAVARSQLTAARKSGSRFRLAATIMSPTPSPFRSPMARLMGPTYPANA